jgi:hypothetical protein
MNPNRVERQPEISISGRQFPQNCFSTSRRVTVTLYTKPMGLAAVPKTSR